MFKTFIIILTFNNEKTIDDLLKSVSSFKDKVKVIVVDNKSVDKTVSRVKKYRFARLLKNKRNIGFAAGNNIGIEYALGKGADLVLLLNPDTILPENFLDNFNQSTLSLLENNNIGIVGPKIYDGNGKIWSAGGMIDKARYSSYLIGLGKEDVGQHNLQINLDYIPATAIFIKKEVFEEIGFFKEDYFLYYEDVDFCLRAKKAGFKIMLDPNIYLTHKESSSVGKNSKIMQYYMARNHLLFLERFSPFGVKIREIVRFPKTIYEARSKKYELLGLRDYFLRRFYKNDYWG